MRNLFIIAALAFGMNVTAQTTLNGDVTAANGKVYINATNGNINTQGQINVGVGAKTILAADGNIYSKGTVNAVNYATTGGKFYVNGSNGNTTVHGVSLLFGGAYVGPRADDASQPALTVNGQGAFRGISNAGQKITGVGNGTVATDAVNKGQLDAVQSNLNTQVERLETIIDTKADKVQVAQDIQHARQQAIRISNEYTDEKISEVNYKVDTEVKRLDDKLDLEIEANRLAQKRLDDKINSNDEKINQRVKDLEIKIDNRFNAVMSYVGNEFKAVNNRIEGLGAMTVALSAAATSSVYNANKPTNLNIATGLYGRATAIAVGMSHFFNSSTKVSVNYSKGSNTKNAIGIGAGFAF